MWIANGAPESIAMANNFKRLRALVEQKVRMIVCIGDSSLYQTVFGDMVQRIVAVDTIGEAVNKAFYSNLENVKILFSPAVENGVSYEEQGDTFKREVNEL